MEKKDYICLKCGKRYSSITRICRMSKCNGIVVVKSSDAYLLHKKSKELQLYKKALTLMSKDLGNRNCRICLAKSFCGCSFHNTCPAMRRKHFLREAKSKV